MQQSEAIRGLFLWEGAEPKMPTATQKFPELKCKNADNHLNISQIKK
jgi:hypothetical protein